LCDLWRLKDIVGQVDLLEKEKKQKTKKPSVEKQRATPEKVRLNEKLSR